MPRFDLSVQGTLKRWAQIELGVEGLPSEPSGGAALRCPEPKPQLSFLESHPYLAYAMKEEKGFYEPNFSVYVWKEKKRFHSYI